MKKFILLIIVLINFISFGQVSQDQNYIHSIKYRTPFDENSLPSELSQKDKKIETVTYFDGLGRPIQTIDLRVGGSSSRHDAVTHIEYDEYGKDSKSYLPYAVANNNGTFRTDNPKTKTLQFYNVPKYENTSNPYSENHYENSPLNRIIETGAPGQSWEVDKNSDNDHTIKYNSTSNISSDDVINFKIYFDGNDTSKPILSRENGHYASGSLYKNIIKNENWITSDGNNNTTEEFKNKLGQIILKRTFNNDERHDTYYVYDDYGNLTFVLPPKVTHEWLIIDPTATYQDMDVSYDETSFTIPFNTPQQGSGGITIKIINDQLSVYYGSYFPVVTYNSNGSSGIANATKLKSGKIIQIPSSIPIPDMYLGTETRTNDLGETFTVRIEIEDGYLKQTPSAHTYIHSLGLNYTRDLSGINNPGSNVADQSILDELCYQYKYDHKNRLIEKKIPGKGWEYIIYNNLDLPILTQNHFQKAKSPDEWTFKKYDEFDRIVYSGIYKFNSTRENLQNTVNAQTDLWEERITSQTTMADGTKLFYTNNTFPNNNDLIVLTENYYDKYGSIGHHSTSVFGVPVNNSNLQGLLLSTENRILDSDQWQKNRKSYDAKANVVWDATNYMSDANSYNGAYEYNYIRTTFEGNIDAVDTRQRQTPTSPYQLIKKRYFFDHAGRSTRTLHTVNSQLYEDISFNKYDNLGVLEKKGIGNTTANPLQWVDYKYNVRGWIKEINNIAYLGDDLFAYKLNYDSKEMNSPNSVLYNGHISENLWRTVNDEIGTPKTRGYAYTYDDLNRLTNADFGVKTGSIYNLTSGFDVNIGEYDKNGNIKRLKRDNLTETIDDLTYSYMYNGLSNKLMNVLDLASGSDSQKGFNDVNLGTGPPDFTYDYNGNLKADYNKRFYFIEYNHLDLPKLYNSMNYGNKLELKYNSSGEKIQKIKKIPGNPDVVTSYFGDFIYVDNELTYIKHAEGYLQPASTVGNFDFVYTFKDHLGNIRLTYSDLDGDNSIDAPSEVLSEKNYYPFGLKHEGYNEGTIMDYPFGYNGKEETKEIGVNLLDFGARNYDASLGRWMNLDPLSELGRRWSPYTFAFNNPVRFVDPDGMWPKWSSVLDAVQTGLDVVGMIPGVGNAADLINAGVSVARGDYAGAALNLAAAVPGAGQAVTALKIAKKAAKVADKVNDAKKAVKVVDKASDVKKVIPKTPRGKGSVEPSKRDPKRVISKKEKKEMLDDNGGKCEKCSKDLELDDAKAHHIERHADGGPTTKENTAILCDGCHKEVHRK
ncbi:DUF6443 domain-containing protein [Urechidicola croceus]|uniref:C2H2-type domain-containing protein n=1 Tax=Urechidicola croceus TaxID=1850246 RepID=A0A1D8P872_9FLAO|nr:DUF6443 domain-containing protein [Urechidicola croceus]AOW20769.1 hypothetical protein LPB138_08805 [Urechidicola croceus]